MDFVAAREGSRTRWTAISVLTDVFDNVDGVTECLWVSSIAQQSEMKEQWTDNCERRAGKQVEDYVHDVSLDIWI